MPRHLLHPDPARLKYVTLLRDPVKRVVSEFFWGCGAKARRGPQDSPRPHPQKPLIQPVILTSLKPTLRPANQPPRSDAPVGWPPRAPPTGLGQVNHRFTGEHEGKVLFDWHRPLWNAMGKGCLKGAPGPELQKWLDDPANPAHNRCALSPSLFRNGVSQHHPHTPPPPLSPSLLCPSSYARMLANNTRAPPLRVRHNCIIGNEEASITVWASRYGQGEGGSCFWQRSAVDRAHGAAGGRPCAAFIRDFCSPCVSGMGSRAAAKETASPRSVSFFFVFVLQAT